MVLHLEEAVLSSHFPRSTRFLLGAGALAVATCLSPTAAQAAPPACELDRPILFGGMNWESNLIVVDIERAILEKGYGCKTRVESGETLPMLAALQRGDVDVNSEIWLNSVREPWEKAVATGKVAKAGDLFPGGEGWFIPRYVAERFPELKKASDLPKFKQEFADPEEPGKGRFYGCPAGWGCEVTSTNLFRSLGLEKDFVLYSPGTGAAQKAALTSAYNRKQNIAFYYWYPTPLVGGLDLVKLELPAYDAAAHACNTSPTCANPKPSDYPENPVFTAVNTEFANKAPVSAAFLGKVAIARDTVEKLLAWYDDAGVETSEAAEHFLKQYPDVWTKWVPADVADRVKASL
jgi:glycine betaine/proline transport system substrate-binding protein